MDAWPSTMNRTSPCTNPSRRSSSANAHHSPVAQFCSCYLLSGSFWRIRNSAALTLSRCPFLSLFSDIVPPEVASQWEPARLAGLSVWR